MSDDTKPAYLIDDYCCDDMVEFRQAGGSGAKMTIDATCVSLVKQETYHTSLLVVDAWVQVGEDYAEVLRKLGWTKPPCGFGAQTS